MTLSDLIGAIDAVVRKRLSPALNETARGDCIWFRGATTTPAFDLVPVRAALSAAGYFRCHEAAQTPL